MSEATPRRAWRVRPRRLVNTLTLATPTGLLLARLSRARLVAGPRGTVLALDYDLPFPAPRASAVTIGDVVLLRLDEAQVECRPGLLEHEARHADQWASGLGLLGFPLAYGVAGLVSWLGGRRGDTQRLRAGRRAGRRRLRPTRPLAAPASTPVQDADAAMLFTRLTRRRPAPR